MAEAFPWLKTISAQGTTVRTPGHTTGGGGIYELQIRFYEKSVDPLEENVTFAIEVWFVAVKTGTGDPNTWHFKNGNRLTLVVDGVTKYNAVDVGTVHVISNGTEGDGKETNLLNGQMTTSGVPRPQTIYVTKKRDADGYARVSASAKFYNAAGTANPEKINILAFTINVPSDGTSYTQSSYTVLNPTNVYYKKNGVWLLSDPSANDNGTWYNGNRGYAKDEGKWYG